MSVRMWGGIVAAVAIVVLASGCNPDKNKLLFKPVQGAKRVVDTEEATNNTVKAAGMSMSSGSSMEYTFEMTTQSVDDAGNAVFDVAIKNVTYDMTTGMEAFMSGPGASQVPGMSKDDPFGTKALKTAMESAEGESFTVKVSKLGDVLEVSGADAIADKVAAGFKMPVAGSPVSAKQLFGWLIGDSAMTRTMGAVFAARPDKKLNPGDTWQGKNSGCGAMVSLKQDSTCTVKERAGGAVSADLAAEVELSMGDLMKQMGELPGIKLDLSGQSTGTLKFDEATGWLVDSTTTATIPGSISMTVPQAGNMSIPIEASYKFTVKSYPS